MPEQRSENDADRAVAYGAKSTEDRHGSISTQLADCRTLAASEGWEITGEFSDEAASAYRGDRGPGLAQALAEAERLRCPLIVQHSDRLARGDGDRSRHLVEIVLWARKAGVRLVSVQDPQTFDGMGLVYAALMGDRNHEDSARKSKATRAGLQRRKESGKPVGPIPLGYTVEKRIVDGDTLTKRVIDSATAPTIQRIFDLVEAGSTSGDVARVLNAEGLRRRRGGPWISPTVRKIVHNDSYAGRNGYPQIIDPERFDALHANLARPDPVQVSRQRGGRPGDEAHFLRGIAFCRSCGAMLYTRRQAAGRIYMCKNRRQSTGLCSAPVIPAELVEDHVLRHLDSFVGSVEGWLQERLEDRDSERREREATLARQRAQLTALDRQRAKYMAEYRSLVEEGATTARIALEEVERIDREKAEQEQAIQEAEAIVSEWSGPPDVDAALDFYGQLVDLVQGRIQKAEGAAELNRALRQVVAGLWVEIETDRDRMLVDFELVDQPKATLPWGEPVIFDHRPTLPPRRLDDRTEPLSPWEEAELERYLEGDQTGDQTTMKAWRAPGGG